MKRYNEGRLTPLPSDREFLRAVSACQANHFLRGATANRVAAKLGIQGARRLGRGAVAHSWTGTMSAALRASPRLNALTKRGLLYRWYDTENHRYMYALTESGSEEADRQDG